MWGRNFYLKGGEQTEGLVTGFEVNPSPAPNLLCKPRWHLHLDGFSKLPWEVYQSGEGMTLVLGSASDRVAYFSTLPHPTLEELTTLRLGV